MTSKSPIYMVVDKNAFDATTPPKRAADSELFRWLAYSRRHQVIITDYALMESVTGRSTTNLSRSLSIIRCFPEQLVCTRPTGECAGIDLRRGNRNRLFDQVQTESLRRLCCQVGPDLVLPQRVAATISEQGLIASAHLQRLIDNDGGINEQLRACQDRLNFQDRASVIAYNRLRPATLAWVRDDVIAFAVSIYQHLCQTGVYVPDIEVTTSLTFAYALASIGQRLDLVSTGAGPGMSPLTHRNNMVDANYVAYGLVFDGIITNDRRARAMYRRARWLRKQLVS